MKWYIIFVLAILTSCAAKKRAAELEAQPLWMKQKPIVTGYYTGVGSAKKTGTRLEYIERAKKDALANLAQDISVRISSTSVLYTFETQYGHTDNFDQQIKTSTDDYLEGFEPLESYENDNSYWVYYRINKITYQEKKEKKKNEALAMAKSKYMDGHQQQLNNDPAGAMTFYLQGILAINNYLAEDTRIELNGESTDIGNKLLTSINSVVSGIKIQSVSRDFTIKRGETTDNPIQFRTVFNNQAVKGIPVKYAFTGGYLRKDNGISGENGILSIQPGVFRSNNNSEQISATLDLNGIAIKAVDDLFIRSMLTSLDTEPAIVKISLVAPVLSINVSENNCHDLDCYKLTDLFISKAMEAGYNIQTDSPADFQFNLTFDIRRGESAGGFYAAYLNGELNAYNKYQQRIWTKKINDLKGVGYSSEDARTKAFQEFVKVLDRNYFNQGISNLK